MDRSSLTIPSPTEDKTIWMRPWIIGINEEDNLYFSPEANELLRNQKSNNSIASSFVERCPFLSFSPFKTQFLEKPKFDPPGFVSDLQAEIPYPPPKPQVMYSAPNAFFYDEIRDSSSVDFAKSVTIKPQQYITLSIRSFTLGFDMVEPIYCTGFLFDGKRIISDSWTFVPQQSAIFFEQINKQVIFSEQAAFQFSDVVSSLYIVILFHRVLQIDSGAQVDKYYEKPNNKSLKNALLSINNSWPRLSEIYTTFCYTAAPLFEVMSSSDEYKFRNACEIRGAFTNERIPQLIDDIMNNRPKSYSISMNMSCGVKNLIHPSELIANKFSIIPSLSAPPIEPNMRFRHILYVRLQNCFLKPPNNTKSRNILAMVSVQNNYKSPRLPYLVDPLTGDSVTYLNSKVTYHEKNPSFDDLFVVNIPLEIPQSLVIVVMFYHAVAQEVPDNQKILIGYTVFPLFENGMPVENQVYTKGISYEIEAPPPPNISPNEHSASLEIQFISNLIPTDRKLYQLYQSIIKNEPVDHKVVSKIQPKEILTNLFTLIDLLLGPVIIHQTREVVALFFEIAKSVQPLYGSKFTEFLISFANHFAFRKGVSPGFHNSLLDGWGKSIEEDLCDARGIERKDVYLVDFFFILIVKSLYISKDRDVEEVLLRFVKSWAGSISALSTTGLLQATSFCSSFAVFLNLLVDIGLRSVAVKCLQIQFEAFTENQNQHEVLIHFFNESWTPRLFVGAFCEDTNMKALVKGLFSTAMNSKDSKPMQSIFSVLLRVFSYIDRNTSIKLASELLTVMSEIMPLHKLPFSDGSSIHPGLVLFHHVISTSTKESLLDWWKNINIFEIFESLHFLLDRIAVEDEKETEASSNVQLASIARRYTVFSQTQLKGRQLLAKQRASLSARKDRSPASKQKLCEIVYTMQFDLLNILEELTQITSEASFPLFTKLFFHIFCTNLAIDAMPRLMTVFTGFILKHISISFTQSKPVFPRFVGKILELCCIDPSIFYFFDLLFKADIELNGTNIRSLSSCCRGAYHSGPSILSNFDVEHTDAHESKQFLDILRVLNLFERTKDLDLSEEIIGDIFYMRAISYYPSPDSQFFALSDLAEFHHKNEYYAEEIQTKLLQISLLIESLYITKRTKNVFGTDHPACVLNHICPSSELMKWKGEVPFISGFCDDPCFSEAYLCELVVNTISLCRNQKYFEIATELIDVIWPLLESNRVYFSTSLVIANNASIFNDLGSIPPNTDRLFGHFFRVSFFGKQFGQDDGKTFIYREKKLTHLFDLTRRMTSVYSKNPRFGEIELIKESGKVNVANLDPKKLYIQVTFVEPYFSKEELQNRIISFEQNHDIRKFSFDTPFVKGEKKAQGSVGQQWLRKTILTTDIPMPCAVKRLPVSEDHILEKEYEPIRVSTRALRARLSQLEIAVTRKDGRQIQQQLHGNLLVQVNEGPSKMAEVFFSGELVSTITEKHKTKLIDSFKSFLRVNNEALQIHAEWTSSHKEFVPLHHELESGFQTLKEKLARYF